MELLFDDNAIDRTAGVRRVCDRGDAFCGGGSGLVSGSRPSHALVVKLKKELYSYCVLEKLLCAEGFALRNDGAVLVEYRFECKMSL